MRALSELLLIIVGCAVLYSMGSGTTPFYTKGEPREALVVREILRTGEWIVPRRPEGQLTRKPPLYYWLAAAATRLDPSNPERGARIPSIAGGTLGVAATWATARIAFGASAGLPAALILATTLEWLQSATRARIDMTLAAWMSVLLLAWVRLTLGRSFGWSAVAAVATTAAFLSKGPVAVVLPALAAALAWIPNVRRFGILRFAIPLAIGTVAAGLWYVLAYLDQGKAFLDVVMAENLGRFVDTTAAETGHRHGIAYLIGLGLAGLLPWTLMAPLAAGPARAWREPPATMLWAWAIVIPIFFAAASSKRVEYLLPAYPAVAALLGAGLSMLVTTRIERATRLFTWLYRPVLVVIGALLALMATGIDPSALFERWLNPRDAHTIRAFAVTAGRWRVPFLAVAALAVAMAFVVERRRRASDWRGLALALGITLVGAVGVFQAVLHPELARAQSPRDFLHAIATQIRLDDPVYAFEPIDQQLRFYAPPNLTRFPKGGLDLPGIGLVWEREIRLRRDQNGNALEVLARDSAVSGRRGPLYLVRLPPGPLRRGPSPDQKG